MASPNPSPGRPLTMVFGQRECEAFPLEAGSLNESGREGRRPNLRSYSPSRRPASSAGLSQRARPGRPGYYRERRAEETGGGRGSRAPAEAPTRPCVTRPPPLRGSQGSPPRTETSERSCGVGLRVKTRARRQPATDGRTPTWRSRAGRPPSPIRVGARRQSPQAPPSPAQASRAPLPEIRPWQRRLEGTFWAMTYLPSASAASRLPGSLETARNSAYDKDMLNPAPDPHTGDNRVCSQEGARRGLRARGRGQQGAPFTVTGPQVPARLLPPSRALNLPTRRGARVARDQADACLQAGLRERPRPMSEGQTKPGRVRGRPGRLPSDACPARGIRAFDQRPPYRLGGWGGGPAAHRAAGRPPGPAEGLQRTGQGPPGSPRLSPHP